MRGFSTLGFPSRTNKSLDLNNLSITEQAAVRDALSLEGPTKLRAEFSFDSTVLRQLSRTGIFTIIPAPGEGKFIYALDFLIVYTPGDEAYDNLNSTYLSMQAYDGERLWSANFNDGQDEIVGGILIDSNYTRVALENLPLVLTSANASTPTQGNGSLSGWINYLIIDL